MQGMIGHKPVAVAGILVFSMVCMAGPKDEATAIINRAIRVHGGESALNRAQAGVRKCQGTVVVGAESESVPFSQVQEFNYPDKLRVKAEIKQRGTTLSVINGNQGWYQAGGTVNEMGNAVKEEVRQEMFIWYLSTLTPLLSGKYQTTTVGEGRVNNKLATGVKVSAVGQKEVILYFDNDSGKLVKIVNKIRFAGLPVDKEYLLHDHKLFEGALLPTRVVETVDGRKYTEAKDCVFEIRKVDDHIFTKP